MFTKGCNGNVKKLRHPIEPAYFGTNFNLRGGLTTRQS